MGEPSGDEGGRRVRPANALGRGRRRVKEGFWGGFFNKIHFSFFTPFSELHQAEVLAS